MTAYSLPRPWILHWPFRRTPAAGEVASRNGARPGACGRNRGSGRPAPNGPIEMDAGLCREAARAPHLTPPPDWPQPLAGLRIARAVQPSRGQASRVPAIVRRSPCRLTEAGGAATLRSDPQDPQRVRISGRIADVCAALDQLVAGQEAATVA